MAIQIAKFCTLLYHVQKHVRTSVVGTKSLQNFTTFCGCIFHVTPYLLGPNLAVFVILIFFFLPHSVADAKDHPKVNGTIVPRNVKLDMEELMNQTYFPGFG